jgi:hypothetical protein
MTDRDARARAHPNGERSGLCVHEISGRRAPRRGTANR